MIDKCYCGKDLVIGGGRGDGFSFSYSYCPWCDKFTKLQLTPASEVQEEILKQTVRQSIQCREDILT